MITATTLVAWYGAIVSTFGFSLAVYVALRDRPRPYISVNPDYVLLHAESDEKMIMVTVANRGRRPLTVKAIWLITEVGPEIAMRLTEYDKRFSELGEGKSCDYCFPRSALGRYSKKDIRGVRVVDATGRQWVKRFRRGLEAIGQHPTTVQSS